QQWVVVLTVFRNNQMCIATANDLSDSRKNICTSSPCCNTLNPVTGSGTRPSGDGPDYMAESSAPVCSASSDETGRWRNKARCSARGDFDVRRRWDGSNMTPVSPSDQFIEAIAEAVARKLGAMSTSDHNTALMSVKVAAKHLDRTEASVRGLISSGQIPQKIVKRISGRVFLLRSELDKWIEAQ